jgi:hypothetical protein
MFYFFFNFKIIFNFKDQSPNVKLDGIEFLQKVKKRRNLDLYLISEVSNDKEEEMIQNLLVKNEIFDDVSIHKCLFCSTPKGRESMIRQLEPTLLLEKDESVVSNSYLYVNYVIHISEKKENFKSKNILNFKNLNF